MCGIYGEVALAPGVTVGDTAERATDTLTHRGPDERGSWRADGVFLGMRRLSIIDLCGGQQPIWNEDQSVGIVYNGELYNFLELRPELERRGHTFRTRSDTEVVLHAYEEWGADCLRRFNGMFAFAIWDVRQRVLFLARDRLGEKPLYYFRDADRLTFGSEIKAILADRTIPRAVDVHGLANYLTFGHAVAPDTMFQGIKKLLPGHCLTVKDGSVTIRRYWDVGDEPQVGEGTAPSAGDYAARIRELLDDSVRRRMVADVPVGAFLSGGVDSSAVVALMRRHASGPVNTFSLGFGLGRAYDELPQAREVAQAFGTEHHELRVEHVDLIQTLRTLVYHYDEPFGDAAGFPIYLLSRFARQHVKVVLAGDGGDELFGGYRRYAADALAGLYQRLPGRLITHHLPQVVSRLPRLRRLKKSVQALPIPDPSRRYATWLTVFSPDVQAALLEPDVRQAVADHDPFAPYPLHYGALNGATAGDHLNRLMYVDLKTWLPDGYLEKVDKATMACSLEARLPLLDHRLVELAFQIPGHLKVRGWSTKRILKQAVRDLVPPAVLRRPKHGFAVPTDPWFRGHLKEFVFEVLTDARTRRRGYFDASCVERMYRSHQAGKEVYDAQLWLLLNFELWHRIFIDGDDV